MNIARAGLGASRAESATLIDAAPPSQDPADHIEFSRHVSDRLLRFDGRTDAQLLDESYSNHSPMERERAIWEYAYRDLSSRGSEIAQFARREPDARVVVSALWLLQKSGSSKLVEELTFHAQGEDVEICDWSHLLLREVLGGRGDLGPSRPAMFDPSNRFDQTLPLMIAGHARTMAPGMGWVEATLSPLWFEHIVGRVMACTNRATFRSDLLIEKRLAGYYSNGSDHVETYPFRGFTFDVGEGITEHYYESQARHAFYPSGKVGDCSIPPIGDVDVILARKAVPVVVPARQPIIPVRRGTTNSSVAIPRDYVESVRGRYMGTAFVNLERIIRNGMAIGPGEVQLSSIHHPIVGPMTNTFLFGSFKGKLSDLDGDGFLDINTEHCDHEHRNP